MDAQHLSWGSWSLGEATNDGRFSISRSSKLSEGTSELVLDNFPLVRWRRLLTQIAFFVAVRLYTGALLVHGNLNESNVLVVPRHVLDSTLTSDSKEYEADQAVLIDFGQTGIFSILCAWIAFSNCTELTSWSPIVAVS